MSKSQFTTRRLFVDYRMSLEAMKAAGGYYFQDGSITAERFPVTGEGVVEMEVGLLHLNRIVWPDDVKREIGLIDPVRPWAPSPPEPLLAFGAAFPGTQYRFPVVGLCSLFYHDGVVSNLYLDNYCEQRVLRLRLSRKDREDGWNSHCRFLTVRPVASK